MCLEVTYWKTGHGRLTLELVLVRQNVIVKWCKNVPSDGFSNGSVEP
jgi:hypothetical protein